MNTKVSTMINKYIFRISLLALISMTSGKMIAQGGLDCIGEINSSAGVNCDFQIIAQELLATNITGRSGFEITIGGYTGIDTLVLGPQFLNERVIFSIRDTLSGDNCWGYILLEDVFIPEPECQNDTVSCIEDLTVTTLSLPVPEDVQLGVDYEALPISGTDCFSVVGWDQCATVMLCYEEERNRLTCDDLFCTVIYRTWTLTDPSLSPNKPQDRTCTDTIYIELPNPGLFTSPGNWLKPDSAISCADLNYNGILDREEDIFPINDDDSRGNDVIDQDEELLYGVTHENSEEVIDGFTRAWIPTPEITGYPDGIECADCIIVDWKDHIIDGECSRFIERTWKIFGWCSNHDLNTSFTQLIKILDDEAPVITTCIDQVTLYVSGHACTSSDPLPIPEAYDDCDGHKYAKGVYYTVTTDKGEIRKQGDNYLLNLDLSQYIDGSSPHYTDATITWIVDDGCDNKDTCIYIARVEDNLPPVAASVANIQVSLTTDGFGKLFATDDIDAGSSDNCGELFFKVLRRDDEDADTRKHGSRRPDGSYYACEGANGDDSDAKGQDGKELGYEVYFDDYVKFCCEDIDEEVLVIYRVYDWLPEKWRTGPVPREAHEQGGELAGHYNDQWTLVKVEDKLQALNCPSNLVINCDEHLPSLEVNGNTVCGPLDVEYVGEDDRRDACGVGDIYREWKSMTPEGSYVFCSQKITVLSLPLDTFFINDETCVDIDKKDGVIWPCDELIDCPSTLDGLSPDELNSKPIIFDELGACTNVFVGYDDIVLYNSTDACVKILRSWVIIDWCGNLVNNITPRWFYEQNIKLVDNTPPDLEVIVSTQCDSIKDCKVQTHIKVNVDDLCSELSQVSIDYSIDDESILGVGAVFNGYLAPGEHTIYYSVLDGCGNYAFAEKKFEVADCKPPTPICNVGIGTVVMPSNGEVQIWARELDAGTKEDCEELIFGIRRAVNDGEDLNEFTSFIILTCDDFTGANTTTIAVDMQVTDEYGNSAFCTSFINLQDNEDVCADPLTFSGQLTMSDGRALVGHEVVLTDARDGVIESTFTDANGEYEFFSLEGAEYVYPRKNDDASNGINILDLVAIQRHFLGISVFGASELRIASDVSDDHNINVLDLLDIQSVILGLQSTFSNTTSWRYILSSDMPDNDSPYDFTERVKIADIPSSSIQNIDFIGIKTGDVNNSASPDGIVGDGITSRSSLELVIDPSQVAVSSEIRIPITSNNFNAVDGYQMTWSFDATKLDFVGIESGSLEIEDHHIARHQLSNGLIAHNWYDIEPKTLSADDILYTLVFTAKVGWQGFRNEDFGVTNESINSLYYSNDLSGSIQLVINRSESSSFEVFQNAPNPFKGYTRIGFNSSTDSDVSLTIFDLQGKSIYQKIQRPQKGYNEVVIHASELGHVEGVLYYTIDNGIQKITKKMVRTE